MTYFIEKLCPHCRGQGCLICNDTGAIEIQVDRETFYAATFNSLLTRRGKQLLEKEFSHA